MGEVADKKISLNEMSSKCSSLKQLQKVQSAFIKGTNSSSWAEAQKNYPKFATAEQLEPFKKLNFTIKLPEQFLKFCQRVMQAGCDSDTGTCSNTDAIFCISTNGSIGIFSKEDTLLVNPSKLPDLYQSTGNTFSGFTLAVFVIPDGKLL